MLSSLIILNVISFPKIRRTGKSSLTVSVDAKEEHNSSWMRYVGCACHDSQQNLMPYTSTRE